MYWCIYFVYIITKKALYIYSYAYIYIYIYNDGSSNYNFITAVVVVCAAVEFLTTWLRLDIATNLKINSANNWSVMPSLFNLKLNLRAFIDIYRKIVLLFAVLRILLYKFYIMPSTFCNSNQFYSAWVTLNTRAGRAISVAAYFDATD